MCTCYKNPFRFIWREVLGFSFPKKTRDSPNLSDDALKNLFDALSTITLTNTAIAFGLLSNLGIVFNDIPFRARQEIKQLARFLHRVMAEVE